MACSGDVQVVPDHGPEVDQPVAVDHGKIGSSPTMITKEESGTMKVLQHDSVPEPDHHSEEAVAAPDEQQAAEASASSDEQRPEEQKKPAVAKEEEKEGEHNNKAPSNNNDEEDDGHHQESTRERLKRHRQEVAGRVWIPEKWGQEKLLKDWVDCAVFDRPLVPAGLLKARRALVADSFTATTRRRPDNRTSSTVSSAGS